MNETVAMGRALWHELDSAFSSVATINGLQRHDQRAQLWAGFMAAAAGAMTRDLGFGDTCVVLDGVLQATQTLGGESHNHQEHLDEHRA